ncbi:hypothetical protein GCM10016234_39930 [Tianweitania populi]|uniref:Suppressor of fused-like domain-containing protein n=2 Tax=Tianweitania populi TaxID=1607949 RepID=A0A8J3DZD6_9HYPH|nr:hypothetical protein GCM10016234_39930 [Tianweitania populi]
MFSKLRNMFAGNATSSVDDPFVHRRNVYIEELDEPDIVFPKEDGVEILAFGRDFSPIESEDEGYVLLTSGMSDRAMTLPSDVGEAVRRRAELMWYVREPSDEIIGNLRWLAKYPFIDDTWLGFGHRIPMPTPPLSICSFKTFLFLTPVIEPDQAVAENLRIEEEQVEILTVNLISDGEYSFIRETGLDDFLDALDDNDYPPIFDPDRPSYF